MISETTDINNDVDTHPTQDHIAQLVRRLLNSVSIAASVEKFETGSAGKLGAELLSCFDVAGVIEAFIAEITLPPSTLKLTEPNNDLTTQCSVPKPFQIGPIATLNCCIEETRVMSKEEQERVVKAGQILVCSFPKQNRSIELHMKRIVPSLFRVFEPGARGAPSNVFKILAHMLNRNDVPIDYILDGYCKVTNMPFFQLIWRSALWNDAIAMGIFEKIISSTKAVNIIQPRFEKISAMQWIEATLDIAVQKGNDPILSNAVEILSRTVEATALGGAHLDFLFGKFADSLNMIAKERLETIFVLLKSSCLNSESIDSPDHTLTSQQFQVCLNIIHVLAIKSSGRCVVLPTLVDLLDRSNLKAVKERALNLVGDFADILWGPKSLLFGNDEETPKVVTDGINCNQSSRPGKSSLEACVTTTNRVMVLELMVESMFYFIVSAKNCPDKNEVRDSFLESIPWQRLFELLWMKYKNASIYQSLLYKLIYMVLGSQHEDSIKLLCLDSGSNSGLLDSILTEGSVKQQGYFRLVVQAVHKFTAMFPASELAKHVQNNELWIVVFNDFDTIGTATSRKEDAVLAHVLDIVV